MEDGDDVEGMEVVDDMERVEVVDDIEGVELQIEEVVEEMELVEVQIEEVVEDMEYVEVQIEEVVEDIEFVEVQRDDVDGEEVRMEEVEVVHGQVEGIEDVEVVEVFDFQVEDNEEVVEDDYQVEENEDVEVVGQPRVRAPMIYRQAGVTHPLPERHNAGALDRVCTKCNARHFSEEQTARGHFFTCCNNGQVTAAGQRALLPVPYLIQSLFIDDSQDGRRFRADVRRYNNVLAFAAFTCDANDRRLPGRGPPVWIVHGQTYRRTNNEVAVAPGNANNCQLYFLESGEANHRRLDIARQTNHELSEIVMGLLDGLLRDINPYAMAFMNMRQVWLAERALADPAAGPPRPVRMHFVEDAARDMGRNNLPTANEVAAVFVGEGGLPPRHINLVIYDTNPIDQQRRTQFIPAG
ncbi:uncharacterized protein LOC115034803 [Acyrthosiphon pisum]|uniref:Helitron helicase-like domain-containing protein n=1 Tax=Acyrthosiphon pisum TaxID=7029 RepID=A0A8R2NWM5_ACYPI|nr:uncharacterized protein LOC115034803 [Acyrthosiphon pisum]